MGVIILTTQPQSKNQGTTNNTTAQKSVSGRGTTTVADGVVAKVAGIAAQDIPGVYALGGGAARALGHVYNPVNLGCVPSKFAS